MCEPVTIAIFGGSGPQGRSVVKALSDDPSFRVRLISRDVHCQKTEESLPEGIEYYQCNLNDVHSIKTVLEDVHACFVVTYTDFNDPSCKENEYRTGRLIADACAMAGVKHVVFSTQLHAKRMLSIDVRHFDAKAEIGNYMMKKNLPLTCIMVPCFYEDFLGLFKPYQVDPDEFRICIPIGQAPIDIVAVEDVGEVVRQIFQHREQYLNKTVSICGDKLTVKEIAAVLTTGLPGKIFKEKQISVSEYKTFNYPGIRDWANMFYFICRVDQKYNVAATKKIHPKLLTFNEWVACNADYILKTICG